MYEVYVQSCEFQNLNTVKNSSTFSVLDALLKTFFFFLLVLSRDIQ